MALPRTASAAIRPAPPVALACLLTPDRPLVMGILNITPDSFSDGGQFLDPAHALARTRQLIAEGADLIDIGAESTRPYGNAQPVSADDERARLAPVLEPVAALGVPVSIDTMKARIADWALTHGAAIANDVWGLQRDPDMARVVAAHGAPVIVMHNRDSVDASRDILSDIRDFFSRSLDIAARAGIRSDQIVLDPGIGFGKTPEQSLAVLARLNELTSFGCPLLVGASRKRFIAHIAAHVTPSEPAERLGGSIAAHLIAARAGAAILRVHDVGPTIQALCIDAAIRHAL